MRRGVGLERASRMAASDIGFHGTLMGYNAPMDSCGNILGRAVTGGGVDLPSSLALAVNRATNRMGNLNQQPFQHSQ